MKMLVRQTVQPDGGGRSGFALAIVLGLVAISIVALCGVMSWASTNTRQSVRNTDYTQASAASEAATEKVLARLIGDFQDIGESEVYRNLATYRALLPTAAEASLMGEISFASPAGEANQSYVERLQSQVFTNLDSQYEGLNGWVSTYRVVANASMGTGRRLVRAAVGQDLQTAAIPIFQFAIFYGLDLELHSMTDMEVRGRVHSNRNIYTYPSATTTFFSDVTAVGDIIKLRKVGDPAYSTAAAKGSLVYKAKKDTKVSAMILPVGTNNTPDAVREILYMPPAGESVDSALGRQRYYNKAELVIVVTNDAVTAFAKAPFSTTTYPIAWTNLDTLISTNGSFTDQREGKTMRVTELDVSKLGDWSVTNASVINAIGAKPVNLVYVADNRKLSLAQLAAVRVKNGQTLPSRGLTVATPNPLYVKGHFNQPTTAQLGTTNTTTTRPSSLVADAITAQSSVWSDSKSAETYTNRRASDTTINAAILTGIVETTTGVYSGGAHNLCRFLEDWSGKTLTYNGSMVVLFSSARATAPFQQPGAYYEPPERQFGFDLNFLDGTKMPPGTPELRAVLRARWASLPPGTSTF